MSILTCILCITINVFLCVFKSCIFHYRVNHDALQYFMSLQSESHREAWCNIMLLMLTRTMKLGDERVSMK